MTKLVDNKSTWARWPSRRTDALLHDARQELIRSHAALDNRFVPNKDMAMLISARPSDVLRTGQLKQYQYEKKSVLISIKDCLAHSHFFPIPLFVSDESSPTKG